MADVEQGKAVTRAAMNIPAVSATLLSVTRPPTSSHHFHLLMLYTNRLKRSRASLRVV